LFSASHWRESNAFEIRISNEHVGFDWLPYDEAYERLTYENAKETLRKAHVYLENLSDDIGGFVSHQPHDLSSKSKENKATELQEN